MIARIGLAIDSFATFKKPYAISSGVKLAFKSLLIVFVSSKNSFVVVSRSRLSSSLGPKILGKNSGTNLPRNRLASVIVKGPPLR